MSTTSVVRCQQKVSSLLFFGQPPSANRCQSADIKKLTFLTPQLSAKLEAANKTYTNSDSIPAFLSIYNKCSARSHTLSIFPPFRKSFHAKRKSHEKHIYCINNRTEAGSSTSQRNLTQSHILAKAPRQEDSLILISGPVVFFPV